MTSTAAIWAGNRCDRAGRKPTITTVIQRRVGCLRLVQCPVDDPWRALPIERTCADSWQRDAADAIQCDRRHLAEVSRLAVVRDFRRRKGEQDRPIALDTTDISDSGHQRFPFIPVGLYLAAFAMADELGIAQLLVLTEPRLARHLSRIGLSIRPVGKAVEHRGSRIPSVMDTRKTIDNLHPLLARMWQYIRQSVAMAYATEARMVDAATPSWKPSPATTMPPETSRHY